MRARRRHPAGRVALSTQRRDRRGEAVRAARKLPGLRHADRQAARARSGRAARTAACPGQVVQALKHFVSRGAMDIEGFGEKLVYRFYDEGLVRSLPDIYGLTVERLEQLEGFQRKSAENLVARSSVSKQRPFHRVLYALGHPGHRRRERPPAGGPLRVDRPAHRGDERGAGGGRGHGPHPGRHVHDTLRGGAQPPADRGASRGGPEHGGGGRGQGTATARWPARPSC